MSFNYHNKYDVYRAMALESRLFLTFLTTIKRYEHFVKHVMRNKTKTRLVGMQIILLKTFSIILQKTRVNRFVSFFEQFHPI